MTNKNTNKATFQESLSNELVQNSKIYFNLNQDVIVTTEDKLRLCLQNYIKSLIKKEGWIAPLTLCIMFLLVFASSNFHDNFIFSADTWKAIFIICVIVSALWSLKAIYCAITTRKPLDNLISDIKKTFPKSIQTNELEIIKATYGTRNKEIDITRKLIEKIKSNEIRVKVSNEIDHDPDKGVRKVLKIKYKYKGIEFNKIFNEGDILDLP